MPRFLIDENLTPALVTAAQEYGFEAHHVVHRGWSGQPDPEILRHVMEHELTLVTNNWDDFRPMLSRSELHPGIVVILPNVRQERQCELFRAALMVVCAGDCPMDLTNTVLEVAADGGVTQYELPRLS